MRFKDTSREIDIVTRLGEIIDMLKEDTKSYVLECVIFFILRLKSDSSFRDIK